MSMQIADEQLKKFIIDSGLVSRKDVEAAEKEASERGQGLGPALLARGVVGEDDLRRMQAHIMGIPFISLTGTKIDFDFFDLVVKMTECEKKHFFSHTLIKSSLTIVLSLIAQSLEQQETSEFKQEIGNEKILKILEYIQNNIYENEKLTLANLSNTFYISRNYLSEYFKKQTNFNVKEYILNYKINLAEQRIIQNMPTALIITELGFTDESHFNKILKKYKGYSIKILKEKMTNSNAI